MYSRDLYLEQCNLHLRDDEGTHLYAEKPKGLILNDVVLRLKTLANDCFDYEFETDSLARTLTKRSGRALPLSYVASVQGSELQTTILSWNGRIGHRQWTPRTQLYLT
jgi:hypothetical protein